MKHHLFRIVTALILILGIVIGTILVVTRTGTTNTGGLQVVAAENFWGDIAKQIGGDTVKVSSIVSDPTADPHLYESNARNAAIVTNADVVIQNGLGYDDFMTKLLDTTKRTDRTVLVVSDILGVKGADTNPHLWYDIANIGTVATAIEKSYIQQDPSNASAYRQNTATFVASLKPLLATIERIKSDYAGTAVLYTEPVPGYVLTLTGLQSLTPVGFSQAIEDGDEPSPQDTQTIEKLITEKNIKVLLYNSQATSPVTQQIQKLARQNGIAIVPVTETLPTNKKSYQSWQQEQLNSLLKALQSE